MLSVTGDHAFVPRLSIRARETADLPRCVEALMEVHVADRYPISWPSDPARWLSPPGLLRAWVAERLGAIVGHVAVTGSESSTLVSRLFVIPSVRKQAIGRRLLGHAQTWAMGSGHSVMLEVAELGDGAAIALYERAGWKHTRSTEASWRTPEGAPVTLRYYAPPT